MKDVLERLAAGECSVAEAEAELAGYATTDAGRFDAAREQRRGVPEAILADGKTTEEVATLTESALVTTGRAIVTRLDDATVDPLLDMVDVAVSSSKRSEPSGTAFDGSRYDERAGVLVVHGSEFTPQSLDAQVAVVTAGTSDAQPAGEAAILASEMGATVERVDDVGVASLTRIVDQLDQLRTADVIVVAAGREGALPTVVAGLVETPVIGLPTSTGYGHGGGGSAALAGLVQSCTVLSVVNVDAGFVAGAQAGLIARAVERGPKSES